MFESHYQLQKNAFRVFAKSIFYSADGRKAGSSPVKTGDEKIFVQFLSIDFTHLPGLCYNEENRHRDWSYEGGFFNKTRLGRCLEADDGD